MKTAIKVTIGLVVVAGLGLVGVLVLSLAGLLPMMGGGVLQLVNRQVFPADQLQRVSASYSSEKITLLPSSGNEVVLEEYLSRDDEDAKATISHNGSSLDIQAGNRGWGVSLFGSWRGEIKLYVPQSFWAQLTLSTSSGEIEADHDFTLGGLTAQASSGAIQLRRVESSGDIALSTTSGAIRAEELRAAGAVRLSSSSGGIRPGRVHADDICASATSGKVSFDSAVAGAIEAQTSSGGIHFDYLEGAFRLSASSGGIKVQEGGGHGSAETSSGGINLTLDRLTGDVSITSSSGGSKLQLPRGSSLYFQAQTSSGSIHTPDDGSTSYNQRGNEASGTFGRDPVHTVRLKATSGGVRLEWK